MNSSHLGNFQERTLWKTYPLNMVLAERWKRISVDVRPRHRPLTVRVEGSEVEEIGLSDGIWNGGWG